VTGHHITELHRQLDERWDVIDEHHLTESDFILAAKIDALPRA
jgi:pterin-4a-carbinolamine dehydratase